MFSCTRCLDNPIHWVWAEIEFYCQTFIEHLLRMWFRDSLWTYSTTHYMFSTNKKVDVSIVLNNYHNHRPWYVQKMPCYYNRTISKKNKKNMVILWYFFQCLCIISRFIYCYPVSVEWMRMIRTRDSQGNALLSSCSTEWKQHRNIPRSVLGNTNTGRIVLSHKYESKDSNWAKWQIDS